MTNKNPSVNETSDKIMQRTKELIAKEKSKPKKELQDRKHQLNIIRDKKKYVISTLVAIIALLTLVYKIATNNGWL